MILKLMSLTSKVYDVEVQESDQVESLKRKLFELESLGVYTPKNAGYIGLRFKNVLLRENQRIKAYSLRHNDTVECEKRYDHQLHLDMKLVRETDAITGDESAELCAKMSCGHAVNASSLTAWCRSLIDSEKCTFHCPAFLTRASINPSGIQQQCKKEWSYDEVRRVALLTPCEAEYFETQLSEISAKKTLDFKECPSCHHFIDRIDAAKIRVECGFCQNEFCWECEKDWLEVGVEHSQFKDGNTCSSKELLTLANCKYIRLPSTPDLAAIPSIRACPTCAKLIEHNGQMCKNMMCPRCNNEFCFACLHLTKECQAAHQGHNTKCYYAIAPIQNTLPIWQ